MYLHTCSFRNKYAVSNVALFSSSLMCFPGVLLGNFLNDSEMVPVALFIVGVMLFTFYVRCVFL